MGLLWSLLIWALFGLIAGGIARWIMPSAAPHGCLITIVVGIIGSVIGGAIGHFLRVGEVAGPFSIVGLILAIVGAVLFLGLLRLLKLA